MNPTIPEVLWPYGVKVPHKRRDCATTYFRCSSKKETMRLRASWAEGSW